ncbi:MAG: hypothetical protein ACLFR7_03300 [Opitutales bacterium]
MMRIFACSLLLLVAGLPAAGQGSGVLGAGETAADGPLGPLGSLLGLGDNSGLRLAVSGDLITLFADEREPVPTSLGAERARAVVAPALEPILSELPIAVTVRAAGRGDAFGGVMTASEPLRALVRRDDPPAKVSGTHDPFGGLGAAPLAPFWGFGPRSGEPGFEPALVRF